MSNTAKKPKSSASRVAAYRQRMRSKGLVAKTIWVPDVTDPSVIADIDRHCREIAANEIEADWMAWIEAVQIEQDYGGVPEFREPEKEQ